RTDNRADHLGSPAASSAIMAGNFWRYILRTWNLAHLKLVWTCDWGCGCRAARRNAWSRRMGRHMVACDYLRCFSGRWMAGSESFERNENRRATTWAGDMGIGNYSDLLLCSDQHCETGGNSCGYAG